jgi:fructosamine-3-kinase
MSTREGIYYWKCDRPNAFFAIGNGGIQSTEAPQIIVPMIKSILKEFLGDESFNISDGGGQGNHLTYKVNHKNTTYFLRIENGPERDDYMEVEASIMNFVRKKGIHSPHIFAVDSSRQKVPFAYQIMENIDFPDLNQVNKSDKINLTPIMHNIGSDIAKWQTIDVEKFGPFDALFLRRTGKLRGIHDDYSSYYFLNWQKHLEFLLNKNFLPAYKIAEIAREVENNKHMLNPDKGCLVHKDLAFWNILGNADGIKSYIDWDDAISGDPTDDISLMGCFHDGKDMESIIAGYESITKLPENFEIRFWLHLMRNIIMKSVIRVGANYFERDKDFFLCDNESLLETTLDRIDKTYKGLKGKIEIKDL